MLNPGTADGRWVSGWRPTLKRPTLKRPTLKRPTLKRPTFRKPTVRKVGASANTKFLQLVSLLCVLSFLPQQWAVADDVHFHFSQEHQHDHGHDDDWEDTNGKLGLMGALFAGIGAAVVAASPYWVPRTVIRDEDVFGYFQKYPYEEGGGFMRLEGDDSYEPWPYSLRWSGEYGYDFDSVSRIGTNLHLETTARLGFDTELNWFDDHDHQGTFASDFWQGDFNATHRFGQSQHAQWWMGLGVNWLGVAGADADYGFNFTYGADVFIGEPWILSGSLDYGLDEDFFHGRLAIGANWNLAEVFVGYDYLNVGPVEHGTVMIGLRTWW